MVRHADLNGRADPSFRDNESRQNFRWHGGRFRCTAGLETTAAAVRMLGFRSAEFYPEDFKGWDTDIIAGGKDTVRIGNYKTFNCRISIEFPPWSTIGGPLMILIENVHGSLRNRHGKLVRSYVPLSDSEIRSFSCNLGPDADVDGAIDIERALLLAVDSVNGKFRPGELIVGRTTGGQATIEEVYTHRWSFRIPQPLIYLVASDPHGKEFGSGEIVEGIESRAIAKLAQTGHTQSVAWNDFLMAGANHFEAGRGANGAIGVRLRDRLRRGSRAIYFDLRLGTISLNGGGAIGLVLEHIQHVRISGRFGQTPGRGTPVRLDAGCANVELLQNSYLETDGIDLAGMPPSELKIRSEH